MTTYQITNRTSGAFDLACRRLRFEHATPCECSRCHVARVST